ncbi:MAG: Hint domain-containing protein, partial [Cyanobacteriota bacterium]
LLQRVLLEESGHHFDRLLNGSMDTTGDEGELVADLLSGDTLTLDQQSTITTQSDAGTVVVDGQTVAVEQAAIAAPTSTTLGATGTTQTINRAAATAISLSLTFDAGNNAGSDILVAAFNGTNLIGWTIYDRSADLDAGTGQTTRAITVSFNLAQFNTNVSTGSLSFRYWQGSAAGTVGNDNLSVTQSGTSTAPFRVNSNSTATITTNITLTTNLPGGQSATWTNTTLDVIAPSASLTGATIPNTGSVTVQSSETGTAYLVNSNVNVTNLTSITAAANNQWNSVTISAANTNTSLSAAGLEDGTYKLYTVDAAGNLSSASSNSVTVDTSAPSASLTTATIPNTGSVTVQSTETGTAYLVNSNVTVNNLASITGTANDQWNSVAISAANTNTSLSAAGLEDGTYKLYTVDAAGNLSSASSNSVTVDTTAPTVSSIVYGTNDGNLAAGEAITLLVNLSENVTVTGTPTLALNSGGSATYTFGSGTNQLTFTYTPTSPQSTADLATAFTSALTGTITDSAGNAVVASGFNNVDPTGTVAVDTTPPTGSLTLTPPPDNGILGDGIAIGGSFSISDLETGNNWQYSTDSGNSWSNGTGTTFTVYGSFSVNQVQVRQVDAAGNAGPATAYDTAITVIDSGAFSPAEITITSVGGSDNTVSSASGDQVVEGTTSALGISSQIAIWAGSTPLGTTTSDPDTGAFSYTLTPANLTTLGADGSKTITALDAYGGSSQSYNFTLGMDPVCFMAGTLISTPAGATPIEQLQPGDLVLTPEGPVAVKFVGRSTHTIAALKHLNKLPVRIVAGALGGHGPCCDTYLTPNHGLALLGCLVEAGTLENDRTITRYQEWAASPTITYLTVELEQHGLIWANGMLAESYYASGSSDGDGFSRKVWDNLADYLELYGEETTMDELPMPRLVFSRQLPAEIRALVGIDSLTLYAAGATAHAPANASAAAGANAPTAHLSLQLV